MWFACFMHSGVEAEGARSSNSMVICIYIGQKWFFFRVYVSWWIPWHGIFFEALAPPLAFTTYWVFWSYLDMELMKEKFSKLLLGEDMSGGGKGVSSALALSNAITNLAGNHQCITKTCWSVVNRRSQLFLSMYDMCSFCFRRDEKIRANASWEKSKMEKRNWLAFICYRSYCWICSL